MLALCRIADARCSVWCDQVWGYRRRGPIACVVLPGGCGLIALDCGLIAGWPVCGRCWGIAVGDCVVTPVVWIAGFGLLRMLSVFCRVCPFEGRPLLLGVRAFWRSYMLCYT